MAYYIDILADKTVDSMTTQALVELIESRIKQGNHEDIRISLPDGLGEVLPILERLEGISRIDKGGLNHPFGCGGYKGSGVRLYIESDTVPLVSLDCDYGYIGASINTDRWIEEVLGTETHPLQESYDSFVESCEESHWDLALISMFLEASNMAKISGGNTSNHENDLDNCIDYVLATDSEGTEYIFLRRHHGGDIRGNYGEVEVYAMDHNYYPFYCQSVGWSFASYVDANGEKSDNLQEHDEEYQQGYSSNPSHHLDKASESFEISADGESIIVTFKDGSVAVAYPSLYLEG